MRSEHRTAGWRRMAMACLAAWMLVTSSRTSFAQSKEDVPAVEPKKVAAPSLAKAKRLYEDNFENPESGFPRGPIGEGDHDYVSGRYILRIPGGPSLQTWNFPHLPFPNSALQVKARVLGQGTDSWGIRVNNYPFHWLIVSINNKGELFVEPDDDVEPFRGPSAGPIKHPAIKGDEQFNTLLLIVRGRVMEIYVNDVAVCDPVVSDRDLFPTIYALRTQRKDAAAADKPEVQGEFEQVTVFSADGLRKPVLAATKKDPPAEPVPAEVLNGPPLLTGDLGDSKLVQERFTLIEKANAAFSMEDRLYQILAKAPGHHMADIGRLGKIQNFTCLAYAKLSQPAKGGWGLAFGKGTAGHFEAQLREDSGEKQFRVVFVKDGEDEVIPWTTCTILRPMTDYNSLRIEATGKTIRVFANGKFVGEKEDSRLGPGTLHPLVFAEAAPVDARFSFVHVWRLKPAPSGAK